MIPSLPRKKVTNKEALSFQLGHQSSEPTLYALSLDSKEVGGCFLGALRVFGTNSSYLFATNSSQVLEYRYVPLSYTHQFPKAFQLNFIYLT